MGLAPILLVEPLEEGCRGAWRVEVVLRELGPHICLGRFEKQLGASTDQLGADHSWDLRASGSGVRWETPPQRAVVRIR